MAKKQDHTTFRNGDLFCTHCGRSQAVAMPIEIPVFAAMCSAFSKSHAKCKKTWREPISLNDSLPPEISNLQLYERAQFWYTKCERGTSSENIFFRMTGRKTEDVAHPHDLSDFRRCYLLLKVIPEYRTRISEMKDVSPIWSALVDNWDKLTELFEEQVKTGKDAGAHDLLYKITSGK